MDQSLHVVFWCFGASFSAVVGDHLGDNQREKETLFKGMEIFQYAVIRPCIRDFLRPCVGICVRSSNHRIFVSQLVGVLAIGASTDIDADIDTVSSGTLLRTPK